MKRQRASTRFYAMELPSSNGHQEEADLSTGEDTPYESDSESEQPLLTSRRKSARKSKKRLLCEVAHDVIVIVNG